MSHSPTQGRKVRCKIHIYYCLSSRHGAAANLLYLIITDSEHVIVAIHGCPGSAYDWRYIGAILEPKCRFIRIELPGHGQTPLELCASPHPDDITPILEEAVAALVPADRRLWLLGHSMGSQLGTHARAITLFRAGHTRA